jgi:glycosyltransferase involved in cell wall biosynthesis
MGLGLVVKFMPIEVVLPTYNGVAYIKAQIDSIYNQTLRPVRVLLRDDGSTDGTQRVIRELKQQYGAWLQELDSDGNLGCVANVNRLLQSTEAPYVALADQDDIWIPRKLELSLQRLQHLEDKYGVDFPMLIHSDLELVDQDCTHMGSGYIKRQRIDPLRTAAADLALTNVVTGCTVLVNRALLRKALPVPPQAVMHDWWLALVATVFGRIEFIPHQLVFYRQHRNNVVGAQGLELTYIISRLHAIAKDPKSCGNLQLAILQAHTFAKRYGRIISSVPDLMQIRRMQRLKAIMGSPKWALPTKHGPIRTLGMYLLIFLAPKI